MKRILFHLRTCVCPFALALALACWVCPALSSRSDSLHLQGPTWPASQSKRPRALSTESSCVRAVFFHSKVGDTFLLRRKVRGHVTAQGGRVTARNKEGATIAYITKNHPHHPPKQTDRHDKEHHPIRATGGVERSQRRRRGMTLLILLLRLLLLCLLYVSSSLFLFL